MLWLIRRLFPHATHFGSPALPPENPFIDQAAQRAVLRGHQVLGLARQEPPQAAGRMPS